MRTCRKINKVSQKELAEKIGVSVMTIRNFESGKTVPDVYTAYRIAWEISKVESIILVSDMFRVVEVPDFI